MKDLLHFLITKITGSDNFAIEEVSDGGNVDFTVRATPDIIGLIIGKEGKTIKNIRKIVSVRAVLEKKSVKISVLEQ